MQSREKCLVKDAFEHFKAILILEIAASKGEKVEVKFLGSKDVRVRTGGNLGIGNNFLEAFTQAHDKWNGIKDKAA